MSHNDKRSVHTDALETLGTIIGDGEARDAIHLAVEPVIAGEPMAPGTHILISDGKAIPALFGKAVGIVDPFLERFVKEGERFWLVVYPRKITSLRHVWTHPDFDDVADLPAAKGSKEASIAWMQEWANEHMSEDWYGDDGKVSPERAYANAINAGQNMSVGPHENARDNIDGEWWDHWEAITGERGDRGGYFSCGC